MLRRTRRPLACLPVLCTLIAVPTAAVARTPHGGSGGAGIDGSGSSSRPSVSPSPTAPSTTSSVFTAPSTTSSASTSPGSPATAAGVIELGGVLNASGDGISLTVAASGTQGHPLTIGGDAPAADAGELIYIESVKAGQANWTECATASISSGGSFTAHWTPASDGQVELRAVLAPAGLGASAGAGAGAGAGATDSNGSAGLGGPTDGSASAAAGEISTAALTIPIFRNAVATLYGPGFWGHHTACGERLTRATLGVASRTLKCGTEVAVLYRGRELTVPVIDRGPFTRHVKWDLTMATARALGIRETTTIGTLT